METMIEKEKVFKIEKQLDFIGSFVVDPVGHSRGIILLWRQIQSVQLISYSTRHIDVEVGGIGM